MSRALTLSLAALVVAACGGGSSNEAEPTKAEFRIAATTACVEAQSALQRTPLPTTEREVDGFARRVDRARNARWRALREVEAPASLRERFTRARIDRDFTELRRLGIERCAAPDGVAAFPGGRAWIERVGPACLRALVDIGDGSDSRSAGSLRRWADELRRVARTMRSGPPPEGAFELESATGALQRTARVLDDVAAGRAGFDVLASHESVIRGRAAIELLDAGSCGELYPALMGE